MEFWGRWNKDLDAVERTLGETGLPVTGFVAEPMVALTDPACHEQFLDGLGHSIATARRLRAPTLIAQAGPDHAGWPRDEQRHALTNCLRRAADLLSGSGITLAVEPLNTLVDHSGYFLPSTSEALDIVRDIGRPEIGILYDIYHSAIIWARTSLPCCPAGWRRAGERQDEDGWTDIGSGTMDWPGLWSACQALGAPWMVVEHDNPMRPDIFARASLAFLKKPSPVPDV